MLVSSSADAVRSSSIRGGRWARPLGAAARATLPVALQRVPAQ